MGDPPRFQLTVFINHLQVMGHEMIFQVVCELCKLQNPSAQPLKGWKEDSKMQEPSHENNILTLAGCDGCDAKSDRAVDSAIWILFQIQLGHFVHGYKSAHGQIQEHARLLDFVRILEFVPAPVHDYALGLDFGPKLVRVIQLGHWVRFLKIYFTS